MFPNCPLEITRYETKIQNECWQSQSRIHDPSRGESHLVFPHCRLTAFSEHCYETSCAPFAAAAKKKEEETDRFFASVCKRGTSETRLRRSHVEGWNGERERRKIRDANLPSRRRGQLCANAIPFSQVIRKTGHPPRSPSTRRVSLSLSLSHLPKPPASRYALDTYSAHIYHCAT